MLARGWVTLARVLQPDMQATIILTASAIVLSLLTSYDADLNGVPEENSCGCGRF